MTPVAVVITALEVEFAAVESCLTGTHWQRHPAGTRYLVGDYHNWMVALVEIGRGNEEAAHATERALEFFRPSVALFVGVAGGVKDVGVGDVVFGTEVHGYEYGKETDGEFLPRGQICVSSYELVQAARQLRHQLRDEVGYAVVVEPIAAGGKVSADDKAPTARLISDHYSQVVAVEQEGLGFLKAGNARPGVLSGVVRGISDLRAGKSESDAAGWQVQAAANAAQFTMRLLDLMDTAEPVTAETVGEHMMAAWLRLRGWPDDPASGVPDGRGRRRTQRLLAELQDLLIERLEPLAPSTDACQTAVAGLRRFRRDPPAEVELGTVQTAMLGESPPDRFVSDVSAYLVEAYLALPELRPDMVTSLHDRAPELRKRLEQALASMPNRTRRSGEGVAESTYRTDYLRAVGHRLDTLQILGIDLVRAVERYSLTTAYVSLSTGTDNDVANVLAASKRLLLVGEAGSGKTTLLQWIAVKVARNQLPARLAHWKNKVPLLVRLRRYVHEPLPDANAFTSEVASTLNSRMPAHWCSNILVAGNGIVLIDGLDELPAARRPDVQAWLDDLIAACPDNVFIITSRPAAVRDNSFKLAELDTASLLPMGPAQITAFVRHWHESTGRNLPTEPDRADHHVKGGLLADHILATPALLDLARTPLLCAVLCALAYARKGVGSLPRRRVELYKAALDMLTGRRDSERRITAAGLDSTERMALLEALAQWLIRNGESEIPKDKALRHIERTLRALRLAVTAEDALQDLVERSILREPATDVLDFVHRTFEEYLAARWMNDQGDIGALLGKAGDPAFNEVIVLVAGLARPREAEELIGRLIDKASTHQVFYALAANCVDACLKVEPDTVSRLQQFYATLVPPLDGDDVLLLATGGNVSVVLLERFLSEADCTTNQHGLDRAVETLGRIGTPEALRVLADLPDSLRPQLAPSLVAAWSHFSPREYAERVLRPLGGPVIVDLHDATRIPFTQSLPADYLVRYIERFSGGEPEVDFARARLHHIDTEGFVDLAGFGDVVDVEGITSVGIGLLVDGGRHAVVAQPTLVSLDLIVYPDDDPDDLDCALFLSFPNLTELQLDLTDMTLVNLNALNQLKHLRLLEINGPVDLTDARLALPSLRTLSISPWPAENFDAITGCVDLEYLRTSGSDAFVALDGLGELPRLRSVDFTGCTSLTDISGLAGLPYLEHVNLTDCVWLDEHARYVIEELPAGIDVELSRSRLDFDLSAVQLQERTAKETNVWADTAHILDPADLEEAIEDFFVRSVVGAHAEDDEFHNGWLVGTLQDIEYPSSEEAMPDLLTPEPE